MRKTLILLVIFLLPSVAFGYTYSSDQFESKDCVADSESAPTYSCDKANDNNGATFWQSVGGNLPDWWYVDMVSTSTVINKITVDLQDGPYLKDFHFEGTNTTSSWTVLGEFTHGDNDNAEDFLLTTSTVPYRYYRFYIDSTYQNYGSDQSVVNEFMGYTCLDCVSTSTATSTDIATSTKEITYLLLVCLLTSLVAYTVFRIIKR